MIEIKDLSFNYKGEERLFSSLSLNIEAHHPVLILSPPGSGKTTLARILTGTAEKYYWGERSGTFLIDDVDLFALDIPERKNYVARSSQNSDEAILFPTLLDEVAFPLEQRNLGRKRIREELEGLLKRYDLEKYCDSDTSELSGGEKRRLNLATLDAIAPRFYIYDEAFDELSSSWRSKLLSLIKEKEYVLVLGSHYLGEYDDLFDSVYEIRDGHLVPYEPRDVFFSFPCLKDAEDPHLLRLEDISFSQRHRAMEEGGLFSLSVPSFEMKSSSLYLLTGENGAGKSTLLSLVCADNPQAYACNISLFGFKRGCGESIWDIKKKIGYVSPEMYRSYKKNLPAVDIVASGLHDSVGLYKRVTDEEREKVLFWMDIFGVGSLAQRPYLQLSSGEQRMLLLVRAFVKDPELLVLDEPFHGLDERRRMLARAVIDAFCKRKDKTLIMVTHYEEEYPASIDHKLKLKKIID